MRYRIYVPSRGRADYSIQYAIHQFSHEMREACYLVVRPDEAEAYAPVAQRLGVTLLQRPETCSNLSQTLDWIIHEHSDPQFTTIMVDDDCRFNVRIDENDMKNTALRMVEDDDMERIFDELDSLVRDDHPIAGVSARFGNNNRKKAVETCGRQMQIHAVNVQFFRDNAIHPAEVVTKSDFHMTLSVLELGYENAVICWASVDQSKATNAAGGVSSYRDIAALNAGAERLRELHPKFVSIVQKKIKWRGIDEPFNDVRCAWKQAYSWGLDRSFQS